MRILPVLVPLLALLTTVFAEDSDLAQKMAAVGDSSRQIALENLLSERGSEQTLTAVIAAAKKNGVSEQAILEARFLYRIDRREDDAIAAMLPDFIKQQEAFKIEDSAIFSVKEDWLAVIEYVKAIASLKKGDKAAFKTHITEAFWLSPRQASAFAPHIDRMRLEDSMLTVKIDFETKFNVLRNGDMLSLKKLMVDHKAMVLHFRSPASHECEASMADFAITAKALHEKGIAVVSILPADSPKLRTDAQNLIQPLGPNPPGAWLFDQKEKPLARDLRVQNLPVFVLVSHEGKILFNGDPADDGLWDALKKIDPQIIRPQAAIREE